MKKCTVCKTFKELTEFCKDKKTKDGLCSQCKACRAEYRAKTQSSIDANRALHREEAAKYSKEYYKKNRENVLVKSAMSYQENKEEKLLYQKEYYQQHKEERKAYNSNYYLENKENMIFQQHERYEKNKEGIRIQQVSYRKSNPNIFSALAAKRRAKRMQAIPPWTTEEDFKKMKVFYDLALKMTKETGIKYEVDHIIPLQGENVSGFHHWTNLQILTKEQNAKKSNKIMSEIVGIFPDWCKIIL